MNDEAINKPRARRRSLAWVLLEFLGSMNLAITLLVVIAIASAIGTVLQQNQPYQDYIIKFGPFWFDVFQRLGLYDVYGTPWFIGILAFLLLSTTVCIYRQAPAMLREMVRFRTQVQVKSLRAFHSSAEWQLEGTDQRSVLAAVTAVLRAGGYRWRVRDGGDHLVVAAMKGGLNRLGYLFTHASIVVICVGGLLDGNLMLKLREWMGEIRIETRDVPARDVPPDSRLAPQQNPSFRGHVMLPEGSTANFVFLRLRDGFLIQELPFAIELKDFRVEYYSTGQPKSFASELVIHDRERLNEPLQTTIEVNRPLVYRGYAIYQSDFGDGGSRLSLRAWPLVGQPGAPLEVKGAVGQKLAVNTPQGPLTLELDDFRLFNILPVPEQEVQRQGERFRNFGPNFTFKLRNAAGEALEYVNYMAPVQLEGRWFFISGVRSTPAESFRYLHIPADPSHRPDRFLRLAALIHDPGGVRRVAERASASEATLQAGGDMAREMATVRAHLVAIFAQGGFDAVVERARALVPEERLERATALYVNILRDTLAELYLEALREEGIEASASSLSEQDQAFFNDALIALAVLPAYGSPFYLQMRSFEQVEASGLQVTRASGQNIVYLGFALLIAGVFIMFYTSHRRLWAWVSTPEEGRTRLIFAGSGNRHQREFEGEFSQLRRSLERRLARPDDS